jgi:hypothetical protein
VGRRITPEADGSTEAAARFVACRSRISRRRLHDRGTLPYVARELGKSVSFAEISKYVEQNADRLKATARFAKIGRGFTTHTLE